MITCVGLNPAIDRILKVESLEAGEHLPASLLGQRAAGKATNVAQILAALGVETRLCTFVGLSEESFFKNEIEKPGLELCCTLLNSYTRINTTIISVKNSTETHLRESGANCSDHDFALLCEEVLQKVKPGELLVCCGSVQPGIKICDVAEFLSALVKKGVRVGLDMGGELLAELRGVAKLIVKPNRQELTDALGYEPDLKKITSHELKKLGSETLLVSDAAAGAGFFTGDSGYWAESLPCSVTSTVGAGDALLAGFLAARESGADLEHSLKNAVSCANSAIENIFAGTIELHKVKKNLNKVKIKKIN